MAVASALLAWRPVGAARAKQCAAPQPNPTIQGAAGPTQTHQTQAASEQDRTAGAGRAYSAAAKVFAAYAAVHRAIAAKWGPSGYQQG